MNRFAFVVLFSLTASARRSANIAVATKLVEAACVRCC